MFLLLKTKERVLLEVQLSLPIYYSVCNVCVSGEFLYRDLKLNLDFVAYSLLLLSLGI